MKGDPKSLAQMIADGDVQDPSVFLAETYFSCLQMAEEAKNPKDREVYLDLAARAKKSLAKSGLRPFIGEGQVKGVK